MFSYCSSFLELLSLGFWEAKIFSLKVTNNSHNPNKAIRIIFIVIHGLRLLKLGSG